MGKPRSQARRTAGRIPASPAGPVERILSSNDWDALGRYVLEEAQRRSRGDCTQSRYSSAAAAGRKRKNGKGGQS